MKRPTPFPRETTAWQTFELPAWRTLTLSVVEMAVLTGILLRAFRAYALTHRGPDDTPASALFLGLTFGLGALVLCGMLTLHLANFPVRRWAWRVPAFVVLETATEMLVSVVLIALDREPLGTTGHAHWHDLAAMASSTLLVRVVALGCFALVLAGVVQLVRTTLDRQARRAALAQREAAGR